jgi:ABC-type nitrate/sulfonate/bicarbonate transport system ATPase subunit
MVPAKHQGLSAVPTVKLHAADVRVHYWRDRSDEPFLAVDGVSLDVRDGEFVAIVGPSGCGKTTFLNAVDGVQAVTDGVLELDGRPLAGPGNDRAMVFQQSSLLPWRTVLGNVAYGMQLEGRYPPGEIRRRAVDSIRLVGLDGFADRYPRELSGGMQQRVNLARALCVDPAMLLLDEPFAALDALSRELMQRELLRIWRETDKTALFVTHDIKEAIFLADRVVIFSARPGRVRRIVPIDLPRPRELTMKRQQRFLDLEDEIWASIEEEVTAAWAVPR